MSDHQKTPKKQGVAFPFWQRLMAAMNERDMTPSDLHRRADVSRTTIYRLKTSPKPPQTRTIRTLAAATGIPIDEALTLAGLGGHTGPQPEPVPEPPNRTVSLLETELEELLDHVPPERRRQLEQWREEERERYRRQRDIAREEFERSMRRYVEMVRHEAAVPDDTDGDE